MAPVSQANIDLPGGQGASKGTDWATRAVNGVQRSHGGGGAKGWGALSTCAPHPGPTELDISPLSSKPPGPTPGKQGHGTKLTSGIAALTRWRSETAPGSALARVCSGENHAGEARGRTGLRLLNGVTAS